MNSIVVSDAELTRIRSQLSSLPWYREILEGYRARVEELIARAPVIPLVKGRAFYESCPDDHSRLLFDPYSPSSHVCPTCGRDWQGEEFDLAWVRQFQDWLGKRLVEAGILYRLEDDEKFSGLVRDSLAHFVGHYRDYPLANNLLGPTRLFQSTYLEAFWLVDIVAAYDLTRSSSAYSATDHSGVRDLLYESSSVVRSYDEGLSNRQAFNNAGMGAVALLYEDEELLAHVLAGPHGFAFHMRESLLEDGIWYEGENYHFATLDHTLNMAEMALHRGIDLYSGGAGYGSLKPMFDGPLKVMLPDLTFPSRKDSWFGRGIGYHKEIYELGFARYREQRYGGLLAHAYEGGALRGGLGWRSFLHLDPELPTLPSDELRTRSSERMPGTGVAVLRRDTGATYASLEYGHYGGGHGHPDRLHLTLFADGVHWLLDPGTGWYHVKELGWYRSTLAHNTIGIDGQLQNPREGELVAFGSAAGFQVAQARVSGLADGVESRRTLCLGEGFLLDVLDVEGDEEHQFDLSVQTPATVSRGDESFDGSRVELGSRDGYEFLSEVRPLGSSGFDLTAQVDVKRLRLLHCSDSATFIARAPGIPLREGRPLSVVLARSQGRQVRFITAYLWGDGQDETSVQTEGSLIRLQLDSHTHRLLVDESTGAAVSTAGDGGIERLAWFGRRETDLAGVSVRTDLPLEAAGLIREAGTTTWLASLPERFGKVHLTGIEAGAVSGLPAGSRSESTGDELRLTQAPGTAIWTDSNERHFFAGARNAFTVSVETYGGGSSRPELDLPPGWRAGELEQVRPGRWQVELVLPEAPSGPEGRFTVSAGDACLPVPYRVVPPIDTSWKVGSRNGGAELLLEVTDRRGLGGLVHVDIDAPWLDLSELATQVELPAGERATIRLPLPLRPPELVRDEGSTEHGSVQPGPSTEPAEPGAAQPLERSEELIWRLPGLDDMAGRYLVSAKLAVSTPAGSTGDPAGESSDTHPRFVGKTRAYLPLYWSSHHSGTRPGRLHLGRADQALWADREWRDEADASGFAAITWDDQGLYLGCEVYDDVHVDNGNKDDAYENDSIQIYFDFRKDHHRDRSFSPGVAAYVLAPSRGRSDLKVLPIAGNREISNRDARAEWFSAEGVTTRCEPGNGEGYRVETFFPYSSLGTEPLRAGDVIGFDLAISDNDGTWYRNTQILWSGSRGRRCYIRGSYHDPKEFGWLIVGHE